MMWGAKLYRAMGNQKEVDFSFDEKRSHLTLPPLVEPVRF